jgi:hypothetical protein
MMAGGMRPGGAASAARAGGGFDLSPMLDLLPPAKLEDLKPGETIVVSSTKGANSDEVTAITLLSNADLLLQMASMRAGGRNRADAAAMMGGAMGLGGLAGGLNGMGGLELPGMIP